VTNKALMIAHGEYSDYGIDCVLAAPEGADVEADVRAFDEAMATHMPAIGLQETEEHNWSAKREALATAAISLAKSMGLNTIDTPPGRHGSEVYDQVVADWLVANRGYRRLRLFEVRATAYGWVHSPLAGNHFGEPA
jgi:hypothetical protein